MAEDNLETKVGHGPTQGAAKNHLRNLMPQGCGLNHKNYASLHVEVGEVNGEYVAVAQYKLKEGKKDKASRPGSGSYQTSFEKGFSSR